MEFRSHLTVVLRVNGRNYEVFVDARNDLHKVEETSPFSFLGQITALTMSVRKSREAEWNGVNFFKLWGSAPPHCGS
jgi:hypothetical protein